MLSSHIDTLKAEAESVKEQLTEMKSVLLDLVHALSELGVILMKKKGGGDEGRLLSHLGSTSQHACTRNNVIMTLIFAFPMSDVFHELSLFLLRIQQHISML